jgi:hypothetical protein
MKTSLLSVFLYLVSSCIAVHAQTDTAFLSHAINSLEKTTENSPIEKVYLHVDRDKYLSGDTVWFKAYNLIGSGHRLSSLSKVIYVDLVNTQDSVITHVILNSMTGITWGDISLDHRLTTGNYRIRAYTNSMRNAGVDYFFDKKIQIVNFQQKIVAVNPITAKTLEIQFFPEGGELIDGIRSKVAVKAINTAGLGEYVEGEIVDNDGNVAAEFKTQHLGMGVFALTPQSGKTYKAKITTSNYIGVTAQLPQTLEKGFVLSVNNSRADSIMVKITANQKLFTEKVNTKFYVVGQSGGIVCYTSAGKLVHSTFSTMIDKKRFPSGIVQFTLFSAEGEPLNERIAFVLNDDTLKLNTGALPSVSKTRAGINVGFDASTASNKPVVGTFSVSVVNESHLGTGGPGSNSILSYLLLTSDLKGHIENPDYYFTNPNTQTNADLDLLMLTQGYRRFSWSEVLKDQLPPLNYSSENSPNFAGYVTTTSGSPVSNGKVTLVQTSQGIILDTVTNENGKFEFKGVNLYGDARVMITAKTSTGDKKVKIYVDKPGYPLTTNQFVKQPFNDGQVKNIALDYDTTGWLRKGDTTKLNQVSITVKKPGTSMLTNSANLNGPGIADQVIMSDKLDDCIKLSDCLNGKVFGVTFLNGRPYNNRKAVRSTSAMVLVVDGFVQSGSRLNQLDPNDVYSIEVLRSSAYLSIYGSNARGGALVITTRKGAGQQAKVSTLDAEGTLSYHFAGYYKARQFYSPKYSADDVQNSLPDLRTTIYWNPNMITDETGKTSFNYSNADTKGTYRVTIEGVDAQGNIGRKIYQYKVE